MTTDTLAKLAAELAQLASEGPALIHLQSGAYICRKLGESAKALAAQALPAAGRCDECGKDQADGWALYCVGCLEKTGLLAKEALPNAQHVSSTAADLTGPNDTAAQATTGAAATGGGVTTGAPSEPFGYFKAQPFGWTDCAEDDDGAVALYERPQQAEQAQSVRLEAAERLAADRLEQMQADRKQALVWRDQAELYEQVRKFSPREFQALWTKNVTSGAMFDDLVRAAIASEAGK